MSAQNQINMTNQQLGRCSHPISFSRGKDCHASPQLFFYSPEKRYWHICLCQWFTWDEETGASVSIYTYCPQYGVGECQTVPPTDIHPRHREQGAQFVIQAVLCDSPSLLCTLQRGHTCRGNRTDTQHKHWLWKRKNRLSCCLEALCWTFMLWFNPLFSHTLLNPRVHTSVHKFSHSVTFCNLCSIAIKISAIQYPCHSWHPRSCWPHDDPPPPTLLMLTRPARVALPHTKQDPTLAHLHTHVNTHTHTHSPLFPDHPLPTSPCNQLV